MTANAFDSIAVLIDRSVAAGHAWLATVVTSDLACRSWWAAESDEPIPHDPALLLTADPAAWRCLESIRQPVADLADWAIVLDALLVLSVRTYDLDALATLLRACDELGLIGSELSARALGFLLAQQQTDGGFGFDSEREGRAVSVRIALTLRCLAVLQRIRAPEDSRMRKNPSSRSPSPAIPPRLPS